jgi:hypothetical protein
MALAYKIIDADGHVLERFSLWEEYMDPAFRDRRPRMVIDENGKERIGVEGKLLGNPRGIGSLGAVGVRQGAVKPDAQKYAEGSTRTRVSWIWMPTASTPLSSTRASVCSPVPSRTRDSQLRCAAPITTGSPIIASPTLSGCSRPAMTACLPKPGPRAVPRGSWWRGSRCESRPP